MICCFLKFVFWVVAYHVIALNYWPATGHVSISFGFTQTKWFLPPHWSRAVVYESINHSTEDTICFSLWDREKLVCETESKLAFVASVCERNYKEKKKKSNGEFLHIWFVVLILPLQLFRSEFVEKVRTKAKKRNEGGGVLPLFFLFLFYFALCLSNFRTKTRSETLTTQA